MLDYDLWCYTGGIGTVVNHLTANLESELSNPGALSIMRKWVVLKL
jgi:hypothetical protein